jgi:hypothetical protein
MLEYIEILQMGDHYSVDTMHLVAFGRRTHFVRFVGCEKEADFMVWSMSRLSVVLRTTDLKEKLPHMERGGNNEAVGVGFQRGTWEVCFMVKCSREVGILYTASFVCSCASLAEAPIFGIWLIVHGRQPPDTRYRTCLVREAVSELIEDLLWFVNLTLDWPCIFCRYRLPEGRQKAGELLSFHKTLSGGVAPGVREDRGGVPSGFPSGMRAGWRAPFLVADTYTR